MAVEEAKRALPLSPSLDALHSPITLLSTPTSGHLQEEVPYQAGTKETCISHPWLVGGGGVRSCATAKLVVAISMNVDATAEASHGTLFAICC
jgi:hypothetical protein